MNFPHAIRLLATAADIAGANKRQQEQYGGEAGAPIASFQAALEKEYRAAISMLQERKPRSTGKATR